jgi:hypothetical protein
MRCVLLGGWPSGLSRALARWRAGFESFPGKASTHLDVSPQRCEHSWDGYVCYIKVLISCYYLCQGAPGRKGEQPRNAPQGPQGEPGLPGEFGRFGMDGLPGEVGRPGQDGRPGAKGKLVLVFILNSHFFPNSFTAGHLHRLNRLKKKHSERINQ